MTEEELRHLEWLYQFETEGNIPKLLAEVRRLQAIKCNKPHLPKQQCRKHLSPENCCRYN